jgi:uncharacterized protein (TIGR03435 family)
MTIPARLAAVVIMLTAAGAGLRGQAPTTAPLVFDAASIKPNTSGGSTVGPHVRTGQVTFRNEPVWAILWFAYGGNRADFMDRLPAWAQREGFDLVARGPATTVDETTTMLQHLLEERFALRMHSETREDDGFALTVIDQHGMLGPGLRRSSLRCPPATPCTFAFASGSQVATGAQWSDVLRAIGVAVRRPLEDRTGLSGTFDYELTWTPGLPAGAPDGVDAFQALRDQFGLKVEGAKVQVPVRVVDHIERPSPD